MVFDPSFERTVQVFDQVGDSATQAAAGTFKVAMGVVPAGQNWLVERITLRYRPGELPTDDPTYFSLSANGVGPLDQRELTEMEPHGGYVAGGRYNFAADEASPIRFYAGEQVFANAPGYGSVANNSRLIVVLQIRATERLVSAVADDTVGVLPPEPGDKHAPHEPAWN